jgi:multicomponent Na+:H+ antiporter subunit C
MESILAQFMTKYNYWAIIGLIMIGLFAMIAKRNLVKKIIGMNIVQTAVILFFVSIGAKQGKTIPIIAHGHGDGGHHAVRAIDYINPLPHVLMLTAIVVSVATLGVALALAIKVYRQYGSLDEDEIAERIKES